MNLPEEIDPTTPVGQLTMAQLESLAGAVLGSKRWKGATAEDYSRHGRMMAQARAKSLTAKQRKAIARKAGLASAAKRRAAAAGPPTEIPSPE